MEVKHLWEVEHPYYCSEGNYFANECHTEYKTFGAYVAEFGDADLDYNLVFRWDWREGDDWGAEDFNGDNYYRNGRLTIYMMHQRKARNVSHEIQVCRADEPAVIEFLKPRLAKMMELWAPLSPTPSSDAGGGEG